MTPKKKPNRQEWITTLNENSRFQLIGRFAAILGVPIILGGLGWALVLLFGMSQDVAVMKQQLTYANADPYHGADAKRDYGRLNDRITDDRRHVDEIADRVKTLEYGAAARRNKPQP